MKNEGSRNVGGSGSAHSGILIKKSSCQLTSERFHLDEGVECEMENCTNYVILDVTFSNFPTTDKFSSLFFSSTLRLDSSPQCDDEALESCKKSSLNAVNLASGRTNCGLRSVDLRCRASLDSTVI